MAKKLKILPDEEFILFGILSQEKDYKLCFEINRKLGTEFKKDNDLEILPGKQTVASNFSRYVMEDEDERLMYLLANRGTNGLLIPEHKQINFFLLLKGSFFEEEKETMIQKMKQVNVVQGIYELETRKLKSKQNLLFYI